MNLDFPFHFDGRGRTADDRRRAMHIRDLIEQVLFTAPGERVNRPDFGSGLLQLVFAPNSAELAAATAVPGPGRAAAVARATDPGRGRSRVEAEDSTLRVTVQYVVRRTPDARTWRSSREAARRELYALLRRAAPRSRSAAHRRSTASTTSRCSTATHRPACASARLAVHFVKRVRRRTLDRRERPHRGRRADPRHPAVTTVGRPYRGRRRDSGRRRSTSPATSRSTPCASWSRTR